MDGEILFPEVGSTIKDVELDLGLRWVPEKTALVFPTDQKRPTTLTTLLDTTEVLGRAQELKLPIKLESSCLENQMDRLVEEIGLEPSEAQIIGKAIRDLAEQKIEKMGIDWPEAVREAFANLVTAILIEEAKAIAIVPLGRKVAAEITAPIINSGPALESRSVSI